MTADPRGIALVRSYLADPDPEVCYAATLSWIELAGANALPELSERIRESFGSTRQAFIRGLFHATNYLFIFISDTPACEQVISALEIAVHDKFKGTRMAAFLPLAFMQHLRASEIVETCFREEEDPMTKSQMLYYSYSLGSPIYSSLLASAMQDPNPEVKKTAEQISRTI
jgi:hypothetical protein